MAPACGGALPRRRSRRAPVSLACSLTLALLLGGHEARAEEPLDLADELTDRAGVVTSVEEVRSVQERLATERGLRLFVVTVDNFSGHEPDAWLDRTAERSAVGPRDLAVVVAVRDGTGRRTSGRAGSGGPPATLALRLPEGTGLDDVGVDAALRAGDARLAVGDADGAVVAVATGLLEADWQDPGSGEGRALWIGGGIAVLTVAGLLVGVLARLRRRARQAYPRA